MTHSLLVLNCYCWEQILGKPYMRICDNRLKVTRSQSCRLTSEVKTLLCSSGNCYHDNLKYTHPLLCAAMGKCLHCTSSLEDGKYFFMSLTTSVGPHTCSFVEPAMRKAELVMERGGACGKGWSWEHHFYGLTTNAGGRHYMRETGRMR